MFGSGSASSFASLMSLKIAKEKVQRNLFLWVLICSVLVKALAEWLALTPPTAEAQETEGKPQEPWPSSKAWDAPGSENTEAYWHSHSCKERAPAGKVPPENTILLVSAPPGASFPHLKCQGVFSNLSPRVSPKSVSKAKEKVKCQEQGAGCSSSEWGIGPGTSGTWERRAGEQRNTCSPKPISTSCGDGQVKFVSVGSQSNPCAQLHGRAAPSAPGRYGGSGLTVFTKETKGNWTKSVSD